MTEFEDFKIGDFVIYGSEVEIDELYIYRIDSKYGAIPQGYHVHTIATIDTNNGEIVLYDDKNEKYLNNAEYILVNEDIKNKLLKLLIFQ